jgi:hypothetical protein
MPRFLPLPAHAEKCRLAFTTSGGFLATVVAATELPIRESKMPAVPEMQLVVRTPSRISPNSNFG